MVPGVFVFDLGLEASGFSWGVNWLKMVLLGGGGCGICGVWDGRLD